MPEDYFKLDLPGEFTSLGADNRETILYARDVFTAMGIETTAYSYDDATFEWSVIELSVLE